jgi:hypothetical protein
VKDYCVSIRQSFLVIAIEGIVMKRKTGAIVIGSIITAFGLGMEAITLPFDREQTITSPGFSAIRTAVEAGDCTLGSLRDKPIAYDDARDLFQLYRHKGEAMLRVIGVSADGDRNMVTYQFSMRDRADRQEYFPSDSVTVTSRVCTTQISSMLNRKLVP